MFRKSVSKPELLSFRAVMPDSLHSQWEMVLPQHTPSQSVLHILGFNNTQTEEWSKGAHFFR